MTGRIAFTALSWLLVFAASVAFGGCAGPPPQPMIEQPPAPAQKAETVSAQPKKEIAELPPPTLDEVQQAVKRIFKDAVVIDEAHQPSFFVGDFNGDESQDLAAVIRPAEGKLSDLNQEFPNWIAREPLQDALPKPKLARPDAPRVSSPASGQTVRFEQRDVLLAIIHGNGTSGWRDPQATQTHLLRDVVGADMRTMTFKTAARTYGGIKPFPSIYGDLIQEQLLGQSGFLHYNGGVYAWYDPKNFRAAEAPMSAHSMPAPMGAGSNPKPAGRR